MFPGVHQSRIMTLLLSCALAACVGCASVPREVVELSYMLGEDIGATHTSYVQLVRLHFDSLRKRTDDFLVERWQPTYLRNFIQDGELISLATDSDPTLVLEGVQTWVEVAMEEIQAKRHTLLDPLDQQERELLVAIDEAFERMRTVNATITAHLNSIRSVDKIQSDALDRLGLSDLRDRIDRGLVAASQLAEAGIQKTIEADHLIDESRDIREHIGR